MMTCREAESRLPLYIDGELTRPEAEALERHLAGCAKCHEAFEILRDVSDNIRAARPVYETPRESEERVREMIRARNRRAAAQRRRAIAAVSAALLTALALRPVNADGFPEFAVGSH